MMTKGDDLASRWKRDIAGLPRGDIACAAAFGEIMALYGESRRRYHGIGHLQALFALLDTHVPQSVDRTPLHFAVWWHDAIHDPGLRDNEEKSAALARLHLEAMGAEPALTAHVCELILATRNHWEGAPMGDGDFFLDADIAILGASPATYQRYTAAVRAEYAHLDDTTFGAGRSAFLKGALLRPRLFRTQIFAGAFEAQARANMAAELLRLQAIA